MSPGFAPSPTPDSLPFWEAAKDNRLSIQYCNACARFFFYPRNGCPHCGAADFEWRDVSGKGRLSAFVISHQPLAPAKKGDKEIVAIVELDEGVRMMTNIVDCGFEPDALAIGAPVAVGFAQMGEWTLPVFHLADAP